MEIRFEEYLALQQEAATARDVIVEQAARIAKLERALGPYEPQPKPCPTCPTCLELPGRIEAAYREGYTTGHGDGREARNPTREQPYEPDDAWDCSEAAAGVRAVVEEAARLRGILAEMLALNPIVSGDMQKVRLWADTLSVAREALRGEGAG